MQGRAPPEQFWSVSVPYLFLCQSLQRFRKHENTGASGRRNCRNHEKEFRLSHRTPEGAKPALQKSSAKKIRDETNCHQRRDKLRRRCFGIERQTDRREIKFADCEHGEIPE